MSGSVDKPMVSQSPVTKRYYYFTRHKPTANGKGMEVVGKKTDVTDSVNFCVEQAIGEFLRYAKDAYGLELLDPEPKTEEDGNKYLYGVRETTGYALLNDLVKEWQGEDRS
ncbi:MAG: hypothetical protein M3P49_02140 [Actinomycetota bacterium]|nr:hypothetical protein [Actinomycetota bacterium]